MGADDVPSDLFLAVGEQRELSLPGLGTAGYRWEAEVSGEESAVTLAWQRGAPPPDAPPRVGASAPERLRITAHAPGRVELLLRQRRPWERSGASRAVHTVVIEVTLR